MFPAKSLTELTYRMYAQTQLDNKKPLEGTPLIPITLNDIDIPESKHPWIARLLGSKLLLKGMHNTNYLLYPPHLLFNLLYNINETTLVKKLCTTLFPNSLIITSDDISPHVSNGYASTEIDVFLNPPIAQHYHRIHRCLPNVFFWSIPDSVDELSTPVLLALTQFVRADGRTLLNMYQIFHSLSTQEKNIFIDLVHKTHVPPPIINFIVNILGYELSSVNPSINHPSFTSEWNTLITSGMSGSMFLDVINPGWNRFDTK